MDKRPNQQLGRYEILAELGRGAMGIVYKARDPQIDRLVAIKTIALLGQTPEGESDYLTRFFLEARAAGRLSHPGIVTIFDVGEETETRAPYIVMEYVAGQSLSSLLSASAGKLAIDNALQLCQELAEALDYAHTRGVVHRDMKPSNVLITEDGKAKIADFGIAKMNLSQITLTGNVLGTPAFMSPEQLEGGVVDGRSDLFSLGVILYTMLTGHRPFQGNSAVTVSFKVANREPVPATAFDSDFPPEIDYVISRAMAKDPAHRYQTGREMALDVSELLRGRMPRSKGDRMLTNPGSTASFTGVNFLGGAAFGQLTKRTGTGPRASVSEGANLAYRSFRYAIYSAAIIATLVILGKAAWHRNSPPQLTQVAADAPLSQAQQPAPARVPVIPQGAHVSKTAAAKKTTLPFEVEHQFTAATLSVWVDGKLVRTQALHGETRRKLALFRTMRGTDSGSLQLAAGKHEIRARITTGEGFDASSNVAVSVPSPGAAILYIKCDRKGNKLSLGLR
jgi:serine/threonine protein kinase